MTLTDRRKQFLEKLIEIFEKTKLPVHYQNIADALGVSKWTAYDILKELEKTGYVCKNYALNSNEVGRSQVVFLPTSKAFNVLKRGSSDKFRLIEDWEKATKNALELFEKLRGLNPANAIQKVIEEITKSQMQIIKGVYIIILSLLCIGDNKNVRELLQNITKNFSNSTEMCFSLLIGLTIGTISQFIGSEGLSKISKILEESLNLFFRLSEEEKRILTSFFIKALYIEGS